MFLAKIFLMGIGFLVSVIHVNDGTLCLMCGEKGKGLKKWAAGGLTFGATWYVVMYFL